MRQIPLLSISEKMSLSTGRGTLIKIFTWFSTWNSFTSTTWKRRRFESSRTSNCSWNLIQPIENGTQSANCKVHHCHIERLSLVKLAINFQKFSLNGQNYGHNLRTRRFFERQNPQLWITIKAQHIFFLIWNFRELLYFTNVK